MCDCMVLLRASRAIQTFVILSLQCALRICTSINFATKTFPTLSSDLVAVLQQFCPNFFHNFAIKLAKIYFCTVFSSLVETQLSHKSRATVYQLERLVILSSYTTFSTKKCQQILWQNCYV